MAMSRFSSTTMLMTEYVPNISMPQKRVNILMPSNSKLSKSTRPNTAQNSVCVVSNRLARAGEFAAIRNARRGNVRNGEDIAA